MNWADELEAVLRVARSASAEDLPRFLGDLETVRAVAWQRMSVSAPTGEQSRDYLLDVEEAASRLQVSTKYLYTHAATLPFTRHIGRRLRFSAIGLDAYIRRNSANHSLTSRSLGRTVPLGDISGHRPQEEKANEDEEGSRI